MKKPVIGLVMARVENSNAHIFSNGLFQNIYTLYDMLQKEGTFEPCIYVTRDIADASVKDCEIEIFGTRLKLIQIQSAIEGKAPVPDLFIEVGANIPDVWLNTLYERNPRLKVATLKYGNTAIEHVSAAVDGLDRRFGSVMCGKANRDAVWVSPQYIEHLQFYKWHYDAKIATIAPYVWSSKYLDASIKINNAQISEEFGRVAVMEPNLAVTKTAIIPIGIIDAAAKKSDSLKKGLTFCTEKWRTDPFHIKWIKDLYSYSIGKLTFNPRQKFVDIFSKNNDYKCGTLLSHQFHNELNYVYLEALHLEIPLVHNSKFIEEAGYYYKNFDVMDGADMLILAIEAGRNGMTTKYKENSREVIWKYSPDNLANVKGYISLIEEVLSLK